MKSEKQKLLTVTELERRLAEQAKLNVKFMQCKIDRELYETEREKIAPRMNFRELFNELIGQPTPR